MAPVRTRRSATLLKRKRSSLSNEGRDVPKKNRYSSKKAAKKPKRRSSSKTLKRKVSSKRAKKAAPKKRISALKKYGPKNAPEGAPFPLNAPEGAPFPLNAPEGAIYPLAVPEAPPVFQVGGSPLMNKKTGATLKFKTNQGKLISQKANDLFALQASKAKAPESTRVAPDPFELKPIFDKKTGGKLQVRTSSGSIADLAQQMQARNIGANGLEAWEIAQGQKKMQEVWNSANAQAAKQQRVPPPPPFAAAKQRVPPPPPTAANPWKSSGAMFPARPTAEQLAQNNEPEAAVKGAQPTVANPIASPAAPASVPVVKYQKDLLTVLPPNLMPSYINICNEVQEEVLALQAERLGSSYIDLAAVSWMIPCWAVPELGKGLTIFLADEIGEAGWIFKGVPNGKKVLFMAKFPGIVKVTLDCIVGNDMKNMRMLKNDLADIDTKLQTLYQIAAKNIAQSAQLVSMVRSELSKKQLLWVDRGEASFGVNVLSRDSIEKYALFPAEKVILTDMNTDKLSVEDKYRFVPSNMEQGSAFYIGCSTHYLEPRNKSNAYPAAALKTALTNAGIPEDIKNNILNQ